ncbi:hypothetical protein C8T65DRAFT_665836 [Cerioporus squamosus]|nr:hypothetical protein C8T65DRAFT_665836 [Cerioporus squamosus]
MYRTSFVDTILLLVSCTCVDPLEVALKHGISGASPGRVGWLNQRTRRLQVADGVEPVMHELGVECARIAQPGRLGLGGRAGIAVRVRALFLHRTGLRTSCSARIPDPPRPPTTGSFHVRLRRPNVRIGLALG